MTIDDFFAVLCTRMGWRPTPWRVDIFKFWAVQEGMNFERTWNPLATTWHSADIPENPEDIGFGPGKWNDLDRMDGKAGAGVRMYASAMDGVEATARTLELSYYANIRKAFADQTGYPSITGPLDFTSWVGSDVYGQRVLQRMLTSSASRGYDTPLPSGSIDPSILKRLARIEHILGPEALLDDWEKRDSQLLVGYALVQNAVQVALNQLANINDKKAQLTIAKELRDLAAALEA